MSQDDGGADPLLKAIGEFRQELIEWIDVQLGSLRESASEAESGIESFGLRTRLSTSTRSVPQVTADSSGPSIERPVGREGGMVVAPKRESIVNSGPVRDTSIHRPGLGDQVGPTDARGRLDALARQLGERLRAVEGSREPAKHADRSAPDGENSEKRQ